MFDERSARKEFLSAPPSVPTVVAAFLEPGVAALMLVVCHVLYGADFDGPSTALLFAVATTVEIGLCQGLRLGGLAGRAAIDQYDVERTILESARGIREREVQRQHDDVQQQ